MATTTLTAPTGLSDGAVVQTEFGNYTVSGGQATVDSRAVGSLLAAGWKVEDGDVSAKLVFRGGRYTATADDNTANAATIPSGLSAITAFGVGIRRSNIQMPSATISESAGAITVADNSSTFVLGTGDVIDWWALGTL